MAGIIAEPIQGVGGFITPPREYFQIVAEIVRNHGGIFISDEVQTAWGRTGGKWFGIEQYGVVPDVITSAKGLGNGLPIGLTVATSEVADSLRGATISTFGGNPVVATAAKAVLDLVQEENLLNNAAETGAYLREGLEHLREKHALIGEVRGMGLMQAIELVRDRKTKEPAAEETAQLMEATRARIACWWGKAAFWATSSASLRRSTFIRRMWTSSSTCSTPAWPSARFPQLRAKKPPHPLRPSRGCDKASVKGGASMHTSAIRGMASGILVFSSLVLISCATDNAPKVGTPQFYWAAAKETFATGDYVKTVTHLEELNAHESEFTARARPWLLVMTSGMARGYIDLADSFDAGARINRDHAADFRRRTNTYRGQASRLALEFVEVFDQFQKGKDDPVPLAIPFPTGNAAPVMQLSRAAAGMILPPEAIDSSEKQAVERGVLLATCAVAGAPEDPAKTQELIKPGTFQVPRATFLNAMAITLFDESQLYGIQKMADPGKVKIFCNRALEALKSVPETKQTKELTTKINKRLKTI